MAQPEERFKPTIAHLYPVILSLAITGALGYLPASQNVVVQQIIGGDTVPTASVSALYFVLALAGSATVMLLLVRKGKMSFLQRAVKTALVFVCFAVALWYSSILFSLAGNPLPDPSATIVLLTVSIAVAAAVGLLVFGRNKNLQVLGVGLLSAMTGLFLGASIPWLTALILAGALVLYDTLAVFRGPIGALAKSVEVSDLPGAVFTYKELSIGMGDMVFYSLLATTALWNFGALAFFSAAVGILAGTFLGFKALARYEMFPGLPFSLLLGLAGIGLAILL
ncbi:MAG: hypothetical protein AUJ07_05515 [Crenarchaeota archaeon 13_1_40CM_3_53_5]|nr:MAG: hypothetical protein AUJ07_05515 [Crenarchaeota archaeon 13_1_40CM_3_53_5]